MAQCCFQCGDNRFDGKTCTACGFTTKISVEDFFEDATELLSPEEFALVMQKEFEDTIPKEEELPEEEE